MKRRTFLGGWAHCGLAIAALTLDRHARSQTRLDWTDPAQRLKTMIRMMGSLEGALTIRWTEGVLSGVIAGRVTPLFSVLSQVFTKFRENQLSGYTMSLVEIAYFTDLESGALLETWDNPFTGNTVYVPQTMVGPVHDELCSDFQFRREVSDASPVAPDHKLIAHDPVGSDLRFSEHVDAEMPPLTTDATAWNFHEVFTYTANRADLETNDAPHVPTTVQKVNMVSWRPWMEMGPIEGTTMTRGYGRVVDRLDDLPPRFIELNAANNATFIDEIDDYLEPKKNIEGQLKRSTGECGYGPAGRFTE